jgi:penicillin-binding protein 1C
MVGFGASSAAVLVANNQTQEILAYVGSPDYRAATRGGQNDGVVASRQPGSTLKPFVYAAAMQHLGYTTATLLPDLPLEFRESGKVYSPRNYDGQFRGPVRLREALANSLNVPAVYTASQLGVGTVLRELHRFGFHSLEKAPEHYGVALALGDGEVTLEELVAAYMAIPNGGIFRPLQLRRYANRGESVRAASAPIARLIRDVLEDPLARATSFGRHGVLEFDFPVGVKTGTSKGARDNWTLGFSDEVTVGVWVGNFDGSPMTGASGVSGAGPLFHSVMREATQWVRNRERNSTNPSAISASTASTPEVSRGHEPELRRVEVCTLSGKLPTPSCTARLTELFIPGTEPTAPDDMHVAVPILNGAIAPGCPGATVQIVETYPAQYETWAKQAGRPLLPRYTLQNCETPVAAEAGVSGAEVLFPRDGAEYRLVEDEPLARQQLLLRGRTVAGSLTFVIDDVPFRTVTSPFEAEWPLTRGDHHVQVITPDGQRSEVVRFRVR